MSALQDLVANIDNVVFEVETALETQLGAQYLPFKGMDKSGSAVCVYYLQNRDLGCPKGSQCPFRHISGEKSVVCKHWLRGLCKKGDQCEFLHEFDLSKMPECYFFSKYNACSNKECPFRHIDPESKIRDCPWYDRGFCRHGPTCKARHRRRVICMKYLNGFCDEGSKCKHTHPRFDIPISDPAVVARRAAQAGIICHNCHEQGHKASYCPNLPGNIKAAGNRGPFRPFNTGGGFRTTPFPVAEKKPLDEVTCYKCGEKGHYANKCSKGALAFLSQSAHLTQEIRQKDEEMFVRPQMAQLAAMGAPMMPPVPPAGPPPPNINPNPFTPLGPNQLNQPRRPRAGEMMR